MKKERVHKISRREQVLALIITILLMVSLLSEKYISLPYQWVSFFIFLFILVKIIHISKSGGTLFEDYISVAVIFLFGIINLILGNKLNEIIIIVVIFFLLYSIGLIFWLKSLLKSKNVTSFILSYIIFIVYINLLFAGVYMANGKDFYNIANSEITFGDSLYFSIMTFSTVGYGDILPVGVNKTVSAIEALTGIIFNTAFIGYLLASGRFKTI